MAVRRFQYSRQRAIATAIVTSILSLAALSVAAGMSSGVPTATITSVASTTLTLGLAGLVYELLLRESVTAETIDLIGLDQAIQTSGLKELKSGSSQDWKELIRATDAVTILLINPITWVQREWYHVLDSARTSATAVSIYMPNPNGPSSKIIAARLGHTEDSFGSQVTSSRQLLEDGWKAAKLETPPLQKGSKLQLYYYDAVPGYEIVVMDEVVAIVIPACLEKEAADDSLALVFQRKPGVFPARWFLKQIERLDLPSEFVNEV